MFNNTTSSTSITHRRVVRHHVTSGLQRMWEGIFVKYFMAPYRSLSGGKQEDYKNSEPSSQLHG